MIPVIDIHSDLREELSRIGSGEVWVVTYSIHKDVFEAIFAPFKENFVFHILVDCGGISPASMTEYNQRLVQINDATLHAKLIFISPGNRHKKPLAYILTGNIRESLVNHENLCVKLILTPRIATALVTWMKHVSNNRNNGSPFLMYYDTDFNRQEIIGCKSIGSGILNVIKRTKADISRMVLMAPWGSGFTISRFCKAFPSMGPIDVYAGCNAEKGDTQKLVWVASLRTYRNCRISRFVQSRKTRSFIHAKAAMFEGYDKSSKTAFIYAGSGNLTKKGFWDSNPSEKCPNIECGILLKGNNDNSRRLVNWFSNRIIGAKSRWKKLPGPKGNMLRQGQLPDDNEEFLEDESISGLQKNGFERRMISKAISSAFKEQKWLNILQKICLNPERNLFAKKQLEKALGSYCKNRGKKIGRISLSSGPFVIERGTGFSRVGFTVDTDVLYGIFIVVDLPGKLPYKEAEINNLLESLVDFGNGSGKSGTKRTEYSPRDFDSTDVDKINVRFPFRNLYILKESLYDEEYGDQEFKRRIKNKIRILDELRNSSFKCNVPIWWKSILENVLREVR